MADPARAAGVTRQHMQQQCREEPCQPAASGKPVCVFCCNEPKENKR